MAVDRTSGIRMARWDRVCEEFHRLPSLFPLKSGRKQSLPRTINPYVASHLVYLWYKRHTLIQKWKQRKTNRTLK